MPIISESQYTSRYGGPEHAIVDRAGNVRSGSSVEVYGSEADAQAQSGVLATVTVGADGTWPVDLPQTEVWIRVGSTVARVGGLARAADLAAKADRVEVTEALAGKAEAAAVVAVDGRVSAVEGELSGRLADTSLSSTYAGASFFKRKPAGGAVTTGDVVTLGSDAYAPDTVATSLVAGGAPLYENVIGGNITNIAPTTGGGTKLSNRDGAAALTGNDGNWNFILGGYDTVVNGSACIASGYHNGIFAGVTHATIGGGSHHRIQLSDYSTIAGGTQNTITGSTATIGGGRVNTAAATATVAGGSTNAATGATSTIGGGFGHTGSGDNSAIAGGYQNTASGNAASVGGGQANTASGQGAAVPGGRDNKAVTAYSVASGRGAVTSILGERAHASSPFVTAGDAQESTTILKRQTTDATQVALADAGGSSSPLMAPVSTNAYVVTVVARRTDVEGDHAAWRIQGCLARHNTGSTMVGTPTVTSIGATAGAAGWAVAVTYSSGRLVVNVTGQAAATIRWVGRMELTTVAVS